MFTTKFSTKLITVITILLLTLSSVQPALAAAPNNDFANATIVTSLPFDDTVDTTVGTSELEAGEQTPACTNGAFGRSVWYRFTPTTRIAVSATIQADFPSAYALYTGNSLDSLTAIDDECSGAGAFYILEPNMIYYFQIGSSGILAQGGTVHFHLETVSPPRLLFLSVHLTLRPLTTFSSTMKRQPGALVAMPIPILGTLAMERPAQIRIRLISI